MEKCDAELIQGVLAEGFEKYEKLIVVPIRSNIGCELPAD